jgi:CRISPR-associated protein Cst1
MPLGIIYVGDPFVDTGIAVLEHRVGKVCEEFSSEDLLKQGDELRKIYSQKNWRGILSIHFPNSGWTNPTMSAAKVAEFHQKVLRGFEGGIEQNRFCDSCGSPANAIVDGSTVPLLSNAKSMDCGSGGRSGFPVCGYCLFAIQFYPLATLKVEGKALLWWSPDRQWTYLLAGMAIREVSRFLAANPEGAIKPKFPRTQILRIARDTFEEWRNRSEHIPLRDIIGCHTSNYRTKPEFDELRLPKELFEFWYDAASGFGKAYESVVDKAWETKRSKKKSQEGSENEWQRRNGFYESLGMAFRVDDYRSTITKAIKYFVNIENKSALPGGFGLSCLFLERLAGMKKMRIEAIREIADRVSKSRENKKILKRLFESSKNFIDWLVFAQNAIDKAGESPIQFDSILTALDMVSEDDAIPRDFWLVRDLIILRALEVSSDVLHELPEPQLNSIATDGGEN